MRLHPGATERASEFGRKHLLAVKYPREIHLVDQLPLTSIGKLDRKALRMRL